MKRAYINSILFSGIFVLFLSFFSFFSCDIINDLFPDDNEEKYTVLDSIYGTTDSIFSCQVVIKLGASLELFTPEKVDLDSFQTFLFVFPYVYNDQSSLYTGTAIGKLTGKTYFAEWDTLIPLLNTSANNAHRGSFEIRFDTTGYTIEELEIFNITKYTTSDGSIYYSSRIVIEDIPFSYLGIDNKTYFEVNGSALSAHLRFLSYKEEFWSTEKRTLHHYWGNNNSLIQLVFSKP